MSDEIDRPSLNECCQRWCTVCQGREGPCAARWVPDLDPLAMAW